MFPKSSRVLVVDDSMAMRTLTAEQLKSLGYKNVEEAENGKVAMEIIKTQQSNGVTFDLIILDWNMPVMNGIDFLYEMKLDSKIRKSPVLVITAEGDVKQVTQAISAGASEYIVKPFDETILNEKMKAIWEKNGKKP